MKKQIIAIIILLISLNVLAQSNRGEKIRTMKVTFITDQLDLTEQEAQAFWPVYNEYEKNNRTKFRELRNLRKEIKDNLDALSDDKALEIINKIDSNESMLYKHRVEFFKKIKDILPPKKIIKLKIAEEDFKRKILDRFKKNKGDSSNKK
ncbi:hypothetical protein N1F78_10455 [Seonamhaeicola sp. MEBiC1930]|uniref:Spy/CpxP family protein refolding chaperone n=1 Tax=Seonamhaeicola sp. MEBiC01930 TaxID=2976768 RepID=UPI003247C404